MSPAYPVALGRSARGATDQEARRVRSRRARRAAPARTSSAGAQLREADLRWERLAGVAEAAYPVDHEEIPRPLQGFPVRVRADEEGDAGAAKSGNGGV